MKNNISLLLYTIIFALLINFNLIGQDFKVAIFLKDKPETNFNPYSFFDQKAIDRRVKHNLPLFDYSDLPVNENYIDEIENNVTQVKAVSRWLNVAIAFADENQVETLKALHFVKDVEILKVYEKAISSKQIEVDINSGWEKLRVKQINRMGYQFFKDQNIDGSGVRVAVFDAGFPFVNEHEAYQHLFKNNKIIKTYDFVKNREDVYGASSHGAMCLSNIAGIAPNGPLGLATGAEFLLARTERGLLEPLSEEENWLMAAEWADKNGADIISSSLGYTEKRYTTDEMDGHTSIVSEAARFAIRKGILVVNAAGNEGTDTWKYIGTPADVDSVLSIGGIAPSTDFHADFSSFGPNALMQLKPNVSAYGIAAVASKNNTYKTISGTSFATPLIAGFAACVLQLNPSFTNMQLFKAIEKSGHLYPYFDYAHGYGIPQASAITNNQSKVSPTFKLENTGEEFHVKIENFMPDEKLENKSDGYLYYHLENKNKVLENYKVIKVSTDNPISFLKEDLKTYAVIRIHYRGYTLTKDLKAIEQ
jgi:serine protease AprX